MNKFDGLKWVKIPIPKDKSSEVYALVTDKLSDEEKKAFGEYIEWYREVYQERESFGEPKIYFLKAI
jgi:hypothetical protein